MKSKSKQKVRSKGAKTRSRSKHAAKTGVKHAAKTGVKHAAKTGVKSKQHTKTAQKVVVPTVTPRLDKSKEAVIFKPQAQRAKSRTQSKSGPKFTHASDSMSIGELQMMAKSLGIPFGGMNKTKLIDKINNYR
jgi:hypothetical protein